MSKKTIFSVSLEWPIDEVRHVDINSNSSLLDSDVVIFVPDIQWFINYYREDDFQGKPSLSDGGSFKLKEKIAHWRRELIDAFDAGKTIFVFCNSIQECCVDTGKREYSGTGRNQRTTRIVDLATNYDLIPFDLKVVRTNGSMMRLAKESSLISGFWHDFESFSEYNVIINYESGVPLVLTRSGDKSVGMLVNGRNGGHFVFLPNFDFAQEGYTRESDDEDSLEWTDEAFRAGKKLLSHLIEIDKSLREDSAQTPPPSWAASEEYVTACEKEIQQQLLSVESEIEALNAKKEELSIRLGKEGALRGLLFEKGHVLEVAIIEALRVLGFTASNFKNKNSEFDVVFESEEGRFLGEAEGKDAKPINIDKLRQLEMNISEDFARDDISDPAKGVLFGNAYRLEEPSSRGVCFTEKCLTAAKRVGYALVKTSDLFFAAKHIAETNDQEYSRACRCAIIGAVGEVVVFPEVPRNMNNDG
ncbi:MAG: hypothetical protein ACLGQW_02800 [Acidobacteriota bacterium]